MGNDTKEDNEENYTPRIFQVRANMQRKLSAETYVGLKANLKYHKILTIADGEFQSSGDIVGRGTGTASGLGVSLTRDTRNNVFYPSAGTLFKIAVQRFDGLIGSDYDFTRLSADVRSYLRPFQSHIIAINGYASFMTGNPPFHMLSLLGQVGERNVMRGYYQGRYRDNNILVLQTEYRMPVWWRFGCAVFGGIGDVSHKMSGLKRRRWFPAGKYYGEFSLTQALYGCPCQLSLGKSAFFGLAEIVVQK
ncbi:MAG: BamA/TamA family outer membrane protein [candidate division KSB1 bacterium]|nr:BamA/TamA family outer membrane protein [candidate division KSB1 bacterium]